MKVSIILPTYNEAENIVPLVREILAVLAERDTEVVVVDDNSPDGTHARLGEAFKGDSRVLALSRTKDPGLANSIRAGIEASSGETLVIMDSDSTHNPADIPRLLHVGEIYDIASASRFAPGGNMESQQHYMASFAYNLFLRVILRTQIQDNLGGFFTIRRNKMNALDSDKIFRGYGEYFFCLLHEAQKKNYSIVEIPSYYRTRIKGQSKSKFFKLFFQYMAAAINALVVRRLEK